MFAFFLYYVIDLTKYICYVASYFIAMPYLFCYNHIMKVYSISDLHLSSCSNKPMNIFGDSWANYWEDIQEDWKSRVNDDDVVLICGDISWGLKMQEAVPDILQISKLPGKKVILRGNHDYWWQSYSRVKEMLPENMFAVQNDCLRIENLLLCGSRLWNLTPCNQHDKTMINREYIRLKLSLDAMQDKRKEGDKVVVMLHYPPFDATFRDSIFTQLIATYNVDAVAYGHLHGKDVRVKNIVDKEGLKYYLTSCDLVGNKLVEILEV